ncbi:hypothetical protein Scep_010021 [Stephania cephalantha]|uniref:Uncharacterized protein n=1 Tax=Stephania cephalantha TaxID=152367 RepID=A0AAP0JWH9_9MAGN
MEVAMMGKKGKQERIDKETKGGDPTNRPHTLSSIIRVGRAIVSSPRGTGSHVKGLNGKTLIRIPYDIDHMEPSYYLLYRRYAPLIFMPSGPCHSSYQAHASKPIMFASISLNHSLLTE